MPMRWMLLAALACSQLALAAEKPAGESPPKENASGENPSQDSPASTQLSLAEIRILAGHDTQHLSAITKDILKSEQQFYDAYNNANDNRLYNIHCNWEARKESRFKFFVCKPVFQEELERDGTRSVIPGASGDTTVQLGDTTTPVAVTYAEFQKHMIDLVGQHPELIQMLQEHSALIKKYEEVQKKKHANGKIFVGD